MTNTKRREEFTYSNDEGNARGKEKRRSRKGKFPEPRGEEREREEGDVEERDSPMADTSEETMRGMMRALSARRNSSPT